MHILELTKTIDSAINRAVKFRESGSLAHTLDKDVFRVISIAIATEILDTYIVKKKDE